MQRFIYRIEIQAGIILFFIMMMVVPANGRSSNVAFAHLRIVSIDWTVNTFDYAVADTVLIRIAQGEAFGGKDDPKYFRLVRIIDDQTLEIQIADQIAATGEPDVNQSAGAQRIMISGNRNCFRLERKDSGTDYCIDVLEIQKQ